eukprot:TRINITY_DN14475_c0_g3_i1.p1 TRINITY_DN14475_c0_g3~~TRINITY_DN14475_c0_g3_i1.p1  ORF type:complete len:105 (+),score=2.17 TRINITY_DN14475_c0_g3_i1:37-351(+)
MVKTNCPKWTVWRFWTCWPMITVRPPKLCCPKLEGSFRVIGQAKSNVHRMNHVMALMCLLLGSVDSKNLNSYVALAAKLKGLEQGTKKPGGLWFSGLWLNGFIF